MPCSRSCSDSSAIAALVAFEATILREISVNREQESVIHVTAGMSKIVVENAMLHVLFFGEQRQSPHAPEEVVEECTVKHLLLEREEHLSAEVLEAGKLRLEVVRHILFEIPVEVDFNDAVHLIRVHDVVEVPLNAVGSGVRIIVHSLVNINGEVHGHRVPAGILVVDDDNIAVVDH